MAFLASWIAVPGARAQVPSPQSPVPPFAKVVPGYKIEFPRDGGSHPDFRLEWWYLTGWLNENAGPLGFQVTFFRVRPELKHANPSAFTPRQILIAHAALSDPAHGRLVHAQRAGREGFALAGAGAGRTQVWIDDWTLEQQAQRYRCRIPAVSYTHLTLPTNREV